MLVIVFIIKFKKITCLLKNEYPYIQVVIIIIIIIITI
jgi:hypothetical protein